jgi:hypothetical protein
MRVFISPESAGGSPSNGQVRPGRLQRFPMAHYLMAHCLMAHCLMARCLMARCLMAPFLLSLSAIAPLAAMAQSPATAPRAAADYGKLPLSFEANQGQTDPQVKFLSRGNGYSLFLTDQAAVLALTKPSVGLSGKEQTRVPQGREANLASSTPKTDILRMELAGASGGVRVEGADKLPGTANYFIGSDPAKWHTDVPTYAKVRYKGVYPGVDLVYYGNQRQLEYDFVVAPGADPRMVKLRFAGAEKLRLDADGDLTVLAKNGEIAFHRPVAYQEASLPAFAKSAKDGAPGESASQREIVEGKFVLLGGNSVGFRVGSYDKSRELVIDPTLAYSTYLGGSARDEVAGIAVDTFGDTYVTGYTDSSDFPTTPGSFEYKGSASSNNPNIVNAFIAKINSGGTALIYSTYLGGTKYADDLCFFSDYGGADVGNAIAIDQGGNAYVTGCTTAVDFPVTSNAYGPTLPGGYQGAFAAKLSSDGSQLLYGTYLGAGGESGNAIAVDGDGDAYIGGAGANANFHTTPGAYQSMNGGRNAFITKLNPGATTAVFSTLLGGNGPDPISGIALDPDDNVYVSGSLQNLYTFPVTPGALQTTDTEHGGYDIGYAAKLSADGSTLLYATYLGGYGGDGIGDYANAIAVDALGDAYVAGTTGSSHFPYDANGFQTSNHTGYAEGTNAFVIKLNPTGSSFLYFTFLGGYQTDGATAIALDPYGDAFLTGYAYSRDFPLTADAYQSQHRTAFGSAFISKLSSDLSSLIYSSILGGSYSDTGLGVGVDIFGDAYIAGVSQSTDFPITSGALQNSNKSETYGTAGTGFIADFALATETNTTLAANANPQKQGAPLTITATVTPVTTGYGAPTGTISFSVDGGAATAIPLNDSGQAVYPAGALSVGSHEVTASYSGDPIFRISTGSLAESIVSPTTTAIESSLEPSILGQAVTFTATVTAATGPTPTGTVTFTHGGVAYPAVSLVDGVASLTTSADLTVGAHTIRAVYSGTSTDAPSESAGLVETVLSPTTTALASAADPSAPGAAVTLTATVSAASGAVPTGTVTFTHGGVAYPAVALNGGVATYSAAGLGAGSHTIRAVYSGSATDAASTSAPLTQVVLVATSTALAASPNPSTLGQAVTFTATVTAASGSVPTGTVTFTHGGVAYPAVALVNGVASLTTSAGLTVGTHTIRAVYSGSSTDAGSESGPVSEVVTE